MSFQGLYFYIDPNTHITHFLEFCDKKTIFLFETSGFLMDYLLVESQLKPIPYKLKDLETSIFYKGELSKVFQKLKRRKKVVQEITFDYQEFTYTGIINSSDKQIVFTLKQKGKKTFYKVYSFLDKKTTTKPTFLIDYKVNTVTSKGHTYREGYIFKYEWHYKYQKWAYFIAHSKTQEYSKRYFSDDLEETPKICI
ncbi:hypothetical protein AD998_16035 [bacterium 336/3]|nr:hypothetical protein AD998_16035 [bacterium 336/3]